MKYARTYDGRIIKYGEQTDKGYEKGTFEIYNYSHKCKTLDPFTIERESNDIEDLCDEFRSRWHCCKRAMNQALTLKPVLENIPLEDIKNNYIFVIGYIHVGMDVIPIAKVGANGKLELLEAENE